MVGQPVFLSLIPSSSCLGPRSISFLASDRFRLLLGGSRSNPQEDTLPTHFLSPFCFDERTVDSGQATIRCEHGRVELIQHGRDNTTLHNGRPLLTDDRIQLLHGVTVELSYYDWMVGICTVTLQLRIHLSDSPSSLPSASGSDLLDSLPANATMSFLRHVQELHVSQRRLAVELLTAQARLQEALDIAAAHICAPPRSYGALLNDLRTQNRQDDVVACAADSSPAIAPGTDGLDTAGAS